MARTHRTRVVPTNVILLQNLIKRDPESYKEEFLQQYTHYQTLRDIFLLNGGATDGVSGSAFGDLDASATDGSSLLANSQADSSSTQEFLELIGFISSVCQCYPAETESFPQELKKLILEYHNVLPYDIKEKIITSLTMLRNKSVISPDMLIQVFFPLLSATANSNSAGNGSSLASSHSKLLKKLIYNNLVQLLRNCNNGKKKDPKLNKFTQALCFNMLDTDSDQGQSIWASKLTRELWKRGIWDDSRTVEIMSQAVIGGSTDIKVIMSGVFFFLGADKEREDQQAEDENQDSDEDLDTLRHRLQINKKTGKRAKKLNTALSKYSKKQKKLQAHQQQNFLNFSALHLLRDPQGFADKLFAMLNSGYSGQTHVKFQIEQKISIMQLLSRMIGSHKLIVLGIYTYFMKYLTPKQLNVTQILSACAQSSHDLVPPENVHVMVRKIADEFVSEGVSSEVCSAGLNTIREICTRQPLCMDETLLQDLTEYKGSKAKAVAMAAKGLITLYREVGPEMLKRKDRGKVASIGLQETKRAENDGDESSTKSKLKYGVENGNVHNIEGLELLAKWKADNEGAEGIADGEDNDKDWEIDSDSDSDADSDDPDGDWVTVESDKEYDVEMSDDDEESSTKTETKEEKEEKEQALQKKIIELSTTKILTPADFQKLEELKKEQGVRKLMGMSLNDNVVDSDGLVGRVKYRSSKEEKLASVMEGREGRDKFGSGKGKRENVRSTTNKEKARKKNFVMMIHKRGVQGKRKMSLRDKQRVLKAHITKQKKKGH